MISLEFHPEEKRVDVRASGRLTREDYDRTLPQLETAMAHDEPFDFFVELEGFKGWELGALAQEIAFDAAHRAQIGRMAVVGDGRLTQWATAMSQLFFPSEVRYFSRAEAEEARAWLLQHAA